MVLIVLLFCTNLQKIGITSSFTKKKFKSKREKRSGRSRLRNRGEWRMARICGVFLTPNKLISLLGQSFSRAIFFFSSSILLFTSNIHFIYYYYSHFFYFVHHFLIKKCIERKFFFSLILLGIQLIVKVVTAYFLIFL